MIVRSRIFLIQHVFREASSSECAAFAGADMLKVDDLVGNALDLDLKAFAKLVCCVHRRDGSYRTQNLPVSTLCPNGPEPDYDAIF